MNSKNTWHAAFQAFLDSTDSNIEAFLARVPSKALTHFVVLYSGQLKKRELLERALLYAWTGVMINSRTLSIDVVRTLFAECDRERLLSAGNELPGTGPFTLYRGVAGAGRARRIRGISWTRSIEKARWFAASYAALKLPNPCVYRTVVEKKDVLAYSNERDEEEFLVLLPSGHRVELIARLSDSEVSTSLSRERQAPGL